MKIVVIIFVSNLIRM